MLAPVYGLMKGVPTDAPMASAYWRKKSGIPADMDPDRDGCGLLWCSPVLPNTGAHAIEVTRLATEVLLDHGFEPQMSISLATERSAICVITISYDREVAGEDDRARDVLSGARRGPSGARLSPCTVCRSARWRMSSGQLLQAPCGRSKPPWIRTACSHPGATNRTLCLPAADLRRLHLFEWEGHRFGTRFLLFQGKLSADESPLGR